MRVHNLHFSLFPPFFLPIPRFHLTRSGGRLTDSPPPFSSAHLLPPYGGNGFRCDPVGEKGGVGEEIAASNSSVGGRRRAAGKGGLGATHTPPRRGEVVSAVDAP